MKKIGLLFLFFVGVTSLIGMEAPEKSEKPFVFKELGNAIFRSDVDKVVSIMNSNEFTELQMKTLLKYNKKIQRDLMQKLNAYRITKQQPGMSTVGLENEIKRIKNTIEKTEEIEGILLGDRIAIEETDTSD